MTAIGLLPGALRVVLVGGFASARSRVAVARSFDLGEAQGASLAGFRYLRFREFRVEDLRISASGLRGFRFEALKLLRRRHATAKI